MAVHVYESFESLRGDLRHRLSLHGGASFFRSLEWFECLANNGMENPALRIYVTSGTDLCALFCHQRQTTLQGLSNFYTVDYGPCGNNNGLHEIFEFIAAERPRWSVLDFRYLHDDDSAALQTAARRSGYRVYPWPQYENWYLETGGEDFDSYYRQRSSQLRNTVERKARKTAREHDLRLEIYPRGGISIEQALAHFQAVYAASWKDAEPFEQFIPSLLRLCDAHEIGRIGMATVDRKPAAAQFWIKDGERSYIYKLAYDEQFGELSVGSILSRAMFAHALDSDNVTEIDYGVGDESYKRDWMSGSRKLGGLVACDTGTLRGLLRSLRERL
ncbi:MAG: GNAT family N-acetyltransferase [Gammaproteobacteria bacterium]|nr:GNAT family N-acetyltransferase [Gammaproteobacteria bacterium]NNF62184.1 GNAT family N-acetyltransferase [Gammaproteobacteria bacterium]NNM20131.1 GNAT family N-acetyltransferase [Gammaproteobacteria bacterium]